MSRVKIVTFVPVKDAAAVRQALGEVGAGQVGEYAFCSYSILGTGRFLPSENANPHIGESGKLESVQEERIEVTCERDQAKKVIGAMKRVHPYEEVAYDVYPLLEESEL